MTELFLNDKNLQIIMQCVEGNVNIDDDFTFSKDNNTELTEKIAIQFCINTIMNDPESRDSWTQEQAEKYCICAMEQLYAKGYTYKDLSDIEKENSEAFNEIVIPCISDMITDTLSYNSYNANDITGNYPSSKITLLDYLGMGYKIKITLDGIAKYYLFDTGAADLIINRDLERELLLNGSLKKEDYMGTTSYSMADNTEVKAQLIKLSNVKVGDYVVQNVVAAIIDDGSLLCGMGLLDKFRKWELDDENKTLVLFK